MTTLRINNLNNSSEEVIIGWELSMECLEAVHDIVDISIWEYLWILDHVFMGVVIHPDYLEVIHS